ncbi:SDR family oxidoreductase [Salibacterium halotolerans]|uniref:NAD(P)-dependent dehydrogenase, short-chain alcohol dehydrogenase family n=1 Tax=Salibacterium halotolerans TaxID=1884432 RepID=A0A1I5XAG0_9BACI|nr:SDR family oxidoreductase [Salibacterium halotolerans]SFQ28962.1 NAD(P)-dependent dehydrogenase, short-chain alcohol dehydrogenase family [Salibacterium halotolerans]
MELPFHVDLTNKTAVVTGGSGVLGSVFSEALAAAGANVVVLARNQEKVDNVTARIRNQGGECLGYSVDVLDKKAMEKVYEEVKETFGPCNILINGAGGNHPKATTTGERFAPEDLQDENNQTFFDLDPQAVNELFQLNYLGTLVPTQVFARDMAVLDEESAIINISSMNAVQPLTKIPAYSGAKSAISNFTQWLAVHFSAAGVRVNAMAPGFFQTEQNRDLLFDKDGRPSERAGKILSQTPMERFGTPQDLVGTLLWLVDERASGFVNGIVVPVDGGFSAYSGV